MAGTDDKRHLLLEAPEAPHRRSAAWTVIGISTAVDTEIAEDLAGLDPDQLRRLAEQLGIHADGGADELREAIMSLVEQPGAPVTGSRRLH